MKKNNGYRKVTFYGIVALVLIIIGYYSINPKQAAESQSDVKAPQTQIDTKDQKGVDNASQSENRISDNTLKIFKNEVSETAKFYPYKIDGTKMEIIAVKATDGTIRTALNTCQICFDSGRGYYKQEGQFLVCQNCGNRFHIDQVEKIKGGCNPVPILEISKQDKGNYISISQDFLKSQEQYFSNWKNS